MTNELAYGNDRDLFINELARTPPPPVWVWNRVLRIAKNLAWRHPRLLRPFAYSLARVPTPNGNRVRVVRRAYIRRDYDLLVDGYWRSANSFASVAFRLSQPGI